MTVRVRIAPSPTGDPHVGTAYVALFNRTWAHKNGGQFLLRIEDTDRVRSTKESEKMIFDSLGWLGLTWDEGPDIGGPFGPYRQSERVETYLKHATGLVEKGAAYYCTCTADRLEAVRKAQAAAKLAPRYDGHCRNLPATEVRKQIDAGAPWVIRLKVASDGECRFKDVVRGEVVFAWDQIDDQILLKSDGWPTYHLANVVDDHLMEITHVIRAEEWISSTPKHIKLYEVFGWEPPVWCHVPLLRNKDRTKISKRKNPTSLRWYEEQGYLPEALVNFLALMGFSMPENREIFTPAEMQEHFHIDRINAGGPVFDMEKLDWVNGQYIRKLPAEELARRLGPFGAAGHDPALVARIVPLIQDRLRVLSDYKDLTAFFFGDALAYEAATLVGKKQTVPDVQGHLRAARETLAATPWDAAALETRLKELAATRNVKVGELFMPVRVAVTGRTATPPLDRTLEVLGRERSLARLDAAIAKLAAPAKAPETP
ncbi:MAG: glutamate--tRNA ligase [Planctomycetes bacterium]|nr:glutamate--tRNA ligase [Planctomycetota bacterium]